MVPNSDKEEEQEEQEEEEQEEQEEQEEEEQEDSDQPHFFAMVSLRAKKKKNKVLLPKEESARDTDIQRCMDKWAVSPFCSNQTNNITEMKLMLAAAVLAVLLCMQVPPLQAQDVCYVSNGLLGSVPRFFSFSLSFLSPCL